MKRISLAVLAFAIGCGGGNDAKPPSAGGEQPTASAASAPKPSNDEAIASIRAFLTDPASGVAFQNVEVEQVSEPLEAPKEAGTGWVYSVSMQCDSVFGDKLHKKNWVMLVGREDGKVKVKECYHSLERIKESALGNEWWAKSGLPEPSSEY